MSLSSSFRAARWLRTTNLVLQAILFVTFFAGLNYVVLQLDIDRIDLTRLRKHSLSAETVSYLKQLTQPVRIVVTFTEKTDENVFNDIRELLREYVYTTEANPAGRITVDYIDVYLRTAEAVQLGLEEDSILFISGDKRRVVPPAELYRVKDQQREAFLGEQAFTAAILDVSSTKKNIIYFLTGHGEAEFESTARNGLSLLRAGLLSFNYTLETLDLARTRKIPDGPDGKPALIISAGATSRYDPLEQELLRKYLSEDAGRLMVFTKPGRHPTGLEALFFDWGLIADDVWILDEAPGAKDDNGALILNGYWPHEITRLLTENKDPVVFGAARSIRPHPSAVPDLSRKAYKLVGASVTAWGERDYARGDAKPDPSDLRGYKDREISLAAAAERLGEKDDLRFSVPVGRLVTFGASDFITNEYLDRRGNHVLFFSALNWLVDRDTQLSIPPRKIDKFQLTLTSQELVRLRYSLLFGLPAAAALFGIIVYWTRRR